MESVQIRSISGPYFSVISSNTGKYGPEITPYLDTFHAVPDSGALGVPGHFRHQL